MYFPQDKKDPIWVLERLTRKVPPIPPKDAAVADADQCQPTADSSGAPMGNTVGIPETYADSS